MYQTDYFIRFVDDPAYAKNDLKRGYSFSCYQFFDSKRDAREFAKEYGYDTDDIRSMTRHGKRVWGIALDGLCGFGPYETAEEAEADALDRGGYNGVPWPYVAIFTGRYAGQADAQDGDLFHPKTLVKVIAL